MNKSVRFWGYCVGTSVLLAAASASAQYQPPPPGYGQQPGQQPGGYYQQGGNGQGGGYYQQGGYNQHNNHYGQSYNDNIKPKGPPHDTLSLRFDPLSWLLQGRPALEIEFYLLDWLTVEVTPMYRVQSVAFVADDYEQSGLGLGADVGFWLNKQAFRGFVLRPVFQVNPMHYASDAVTDNDVRHTEVRVGGIFGNHYRWSFFTLELGIGVLVDVNATDRKKVLCTGELSCNGVLVHQFGANLSPKVDIVNRIALGVIF